MKINHPGLKSLTMKTILDGLCHPFGVFGIRLTIVARIISAFQAFTFAGNKPGGNNIKPLSGFILFTNKSEFTGMIVLIQKYNYSKTI